MKILTKKGVSHNAPNPLCTFVFASWFKCNHLSDNTEKQISTNVGVKTLCLFLVLVKHVHVSSVKMINKSKGKCYPPADATFVTVKCTMHTLHCFIIENLFYLLTKTVLISWYGLCLTVGLKELILFNTYVSSLLRELN